MFGMTRVEVKIGMTLNTVLGLYLAWMAAYWGAYLFGGAA